jgi:hypothetical protein
MIKNNNLFNCCNKLKLLKHPSTTIIAMKNTDGNYFSIKIQLRMLFIIIECFMLNQIFSILGENEDEIIKKIILSGKCKLIKNTVEANITEIINNMEIIKNYLVISNNIDIDKKLETFENIITISTLKLLSYIKEILFEKNFYSIPQNIDLPKESVQYSMFSLKLEEKLSEFNKSKFTYLFSRNDIIKLLLNPLHIIAKENIKIKKIIKEDINILEQINYWKYCDDLSLTTLLHPIVNNFSERIIKPFGQIIIPKIKDIYEKNPTVETAFLLSKLGIPNYPFLEVLEPSPNPILKQTTEEIIILEPINTLLNDIDLIFKNLEEDFFSSFLTDIIKKSELVVKLTIIFNVKIEYGDNFFDISIKNNMKVKELRLIINELISKKEKISEKIIFVYILDPSSNIILMKMNGKYVEADDKNILSDYDIYEGCTIKILPKLKSG